MQDFMINGKSITVLSSHNKKGRVPMLTEMSKAQGLTAYLVKPKQLCVYILQYASPIARFKVIVQVYHT